MKGHCILETICDAIVDEAWKRKTMHVSAIILKEAVEDPTEKHLVVGANVALLLGACR